MASQNVVFAIDVDYRPEESNSTTNGYQTHLKHWILRVLLSLGHKYGLEKVRWGYKFFHSRTVKSATLITRGSDFKELQEKVFSDFEEELLVKFSVKSPKSLGKSNKLKPSPASCVQNALKEILLDFQWDRPDLTSPTKVTLRPRRSSRSGRNIPLQDYDMLNIDKNILFVVSECPRSKRELEDYLSIRGDDSRHLRDIHEQLLPKGLIHMLMQRKVMLNWADSGILKANHVVEDYTGIESLAELLRQVGGQVVPMLSPRLPLMDQHSEISHLLGLGIETFPIDSTNSYLQLPERMHQQVFPPLGGSLSWIEDGNRQSCSVTLEPVSCRQRFLRAPVDVVLRGVLQDLDTICLSHSASESWILQCTDAELGQEAFQHLKQLSTGGSAMLADVSEGGVVCSAVLLVLSSCTAQLTVLQPLVTQEDQLLPTDLVSLDTTNDLSSDLPDVVSSVLNVMFDIMEDEDLSDQVKSPFVPDWASQDLKQGSCSRKNVLVEGWFPLSDQSGISCDLMESMRLLHAAPEEEECGEEYSDNQQEITSSLSELYQSSTSGSSGNLRSKKRGTQCTPVRQKMKTMCRSLQMLNFARLNVKAQKSQGDSSSAASAKGAEKGGKRCSGDRMKPGTLHFNSEEELITHLGLTYQKAVENRSVSVPSQVQDMLSVVKAFIKTNSDVEVSFLGLVQKHLLKSSKFIRQLYENSSDEESKIRECQLQAVLQLELCRQSEQQENEEVVEQRIEDVADMLRIISRSKDAVYLSKFMQDEVLPVFLNSVPKVLADVYHSLGTQLPEALVAVLPSDFFSDESMAKDSVSVSPSLFSATHSNASSVRDHLEELRNRSAKKRRQNILTRHKSMAEAPQALRQIEMPRKSTRLAKPKLPLENPAVEEPPPPKQAVQEVTKVRRNLFNQVAASPSKKSKMPRSQSVSAVEGLKKRKRSHMEDEGRHTLLTKKVSETPLHKQVSNRLLHRQRTGRRSGESDVCIIEESPIKPATDLRRSPRIKSLTRRHSSVFYSSQQPRSRNLDRAISSSQLCHSEGKEGFNVSSVRSPVRILFGATQSSARLRHFTASSSKDHGNKEFSLRSAVFESQNKTPQKLRSDPIGSAVECRTPQSPRTPCRTVGENWMTLRGSLFQSPAAKSLVVETPKKSPLKGILKTPMKSLLDCVSPNGASLRSPNCRTPKKSVTWSPSPRKCLPENQIDVPESPMFTKRYSPRLITHGKNSSPEERNVFKTPDKVPQRKSKASPGTMPRALEMCVLGTVDPETSESITRSGKMRRTLSLPCKITEKSGEFASVDSQQSDSSPFPVCDSPLKPNIQTPIKSPSSTHRMCTRSGRTPVKESLLLSNKSQAITGFNPSPSKGLSVAVSKLNMSPYSGHPRTVIHPQSCSPSCIVGEFPQDNQTIGQNELNHGKAEEVSSSDSQQFDRSEFSITTDDESIDISEASVVKTQLTGGIKMNIAFSRKPSRSSEVFEFKGKQVIPVITTPSRSYGFRQTPDRRQREAEARLGYSSGTPKISTPKTQQSPACGKMSTPQPLTYEVEMEMQASGLPKLKLRRTDSFSTGDAPSSATKGMASHLVHRNMSNVKAPQVDSPLAQCSRHPGCISPSLCSRGTPAKGTPGKGVQTYICQSITPTHYPTNNQSPLASPLTPSPQSRGWSTPENFSSWPRKKRARIETCGSKEQVIKGIPLLEKTAVFEDPELSDVFRIPGVEELKESLSTPVSQRKLSLRSSQVMDHQYSPEGMDWTETVVQECDARDPTKSEPFVWMGRKVDTPKVKKPVSASGIFALTQSPLLYKKSAVSSEAAQLNGSRSELDISPLCQPRRRRTPSRTYSRKKLLD